MATVSPGWSTSFIYKQDLTSYYMNSLLRSLIRPGIYNANMALKKDSNGKILLLIKKGTTFVFSNDYVNSTTLGIRRNFNHFDFSQSSYDDGMEGPCIIKCTATSDIVVNLDSPWDSGDSLKRSLHAYIRYNPKNSTLTETQSPTFLWVSEGSTATEYPTILYGNQGGEVPGGNKGTRYQSDANLSIAKGISFTPPIILDGLTSYGDNPLMNFYLNVGFVEFDTNNTNFNIITFTGRGLPEYRYSSFIDSDTLYPDIVPDMIGGYTGLYIDIPKAFIGTLIAESPMPAQNSNGYNNWEAAYLTRRKESGSNDKPKLAFDSNGVFAIYGLVSNIKSFNETYQYDSSDSVIDVGSPSRTITFDKFKISDSALNHSNSYYSYWFSEGSVNNPSTPLDVSVLNIKDIVETNLIGKDIWSHVIEHIRSDENSDPEKITDIIPLGLVTVSNNKIISEKTISYLNLQERVSRINVMDIREHNIFNVIPVMD